MSDADLARVHLQLPHCGAQTSGNLLRDGRRIVDHEQFKRALGKFTCRGAADRIGPSEFTGRASEFFGEVIGIDGVYPFPTLPQHVKTFGGKLRGALDFGFPVAQCILFSH